MSQIIETLWYSGTFGCVGIVLINTGFGHKAYIGIGHGVNEKADSELIAAFGAPFYEGRKLWPNITEWAK